MPLKVACAKCGGILHAPDDAGGKKGKCPNCGNILPIPLDAPKVTDSVGAGGLLEGLPTTGAVGNPVPRPAERGFGSTAGLPTARSTGESKPSNTGGNVPNPFTPADPRPAAPARPSSPPPSPFVAAPSSGGRKGWVRVRRGLWWVRTGVFLFILSGIGLAVVCGAGSIGITIPDKDPGYFMIPRVSFTGELLAGVGGIPFLLGCLAVVLGRFGVANAPAASGARGTALWGAVFSCIAFVGLLAAGLFIGGQVVTGSSPTWKPAHNIAVGEKVIGERKIRMNTQERVEEYGSQVFLPAQEMGGAATRFGLLGFFLFGSLGQAWSLGAIGRIGANLQDARTCARSTFVCWLCSILIAVVVLGCLAYALYGETDLKSPFDTLFGLSPGARAGILGGVGLIGAVLYIRMLNAARAAVATRIA